MAYTYKMFRGGLLSTFNCGFLPKGSQTFEPYRTETRWVLNRPVQPCALSMNEFHTSSSLCVDHRKKRAIVRHLNYINHEKSLKHRHNPLVSLPDYTYLDGRPTEIMLSQRVREEKNYHLAKQVVQLVGEMKFAQKELKRQEKAKEDHIRHRQESRLKHKEQEFT